MGFHKHQVHLWQTAPMNFPSPVHIQDVASWIGAQVLGNQDLVLKGINEIHKVEPFDITFVDAPKYFKKSLESAASAIIVPSVIESFPEGKSLLVVDKPFLAYEMIVNRFRPVMALTTSDRQDYEVDETAIIEPGAIIGQHVRIGKQCHIHAGAIIRPYSYLGDRVVVHAGAVIGVDAFYFKKWEDHYQPWSSCGQVIIGDDVWIGAGTTIAKGVSGDTIIGDGTKIDCQVMIGHGVVIGKHCLLAAQVGVAGKTHIGDWCVVYGQAGIKQDVHIGDRTIVHAQSGVMRDLEGGQAYFGSPAEEARSKFREITALKNLANQYMEKKEEE